MEEIKLMKLLTEKKRKIAVLFNSGLGDTLLFIPLLKELKRKQFNITCIFYSKYDNDCIFDRSLVDSKIFVRNKLSLLFYSILRFKHFTNIYINHFGNGNIISLFASVCSKRVTKTTGYSENEIFPKRKKTVVTDFSDAEQNLHLLYSKANAKINNIESFYLPQPVFNTNPKVGFINKGLTDHFILQISAGNNATPFKNWPVTNWLILTERLCKAYPDLEFIITGDKSETAYIKDFENLNCSNCKVLIGKTTVEEVFNLTAKSSGYIGLDSGIMHMAVVLQKKTLTIFGASNENLYGYESIDPENHKVIKADLTCRPCSSWKNANTSRVHNPLHCPDFACLTSIEPDLVFDQVTAHFKL